MAKTLYTNKGVAFTVNDEDYDFVAGFRWYHGYAGRIYGHIKSRFLHKVIAKRAGIDCSNTIVHVDRNRLNNQRSNLKAATWSQTQGTRHLNKNNTSGYKGVFWRKDRKRWCAEIHAHGKNRHLGHYDTPEEAHVAYCHAAEEYFGEFANTGEQL